MENQKDPDVFVTKGYQLKGRLSAPEQYVDGVSQLYFGYPMTKIVLHTMVEPKNGETLETRKVVQYLTMTTVNAIELANLILNTAKKSEAELMTDLNSAGQKRVKDILDGYQANEIKEAEFINLQATSELSSSHGKVKPTKKRGT